MLQGFTLGLNYLTLGHDTCLLGSDAHLDSQEYFQDSL